MNPEIIVAEEKFDILGNLPKEICYKILFYLTPEDIANSYACCKKWQEHVNYKLIWKKIYRDREEEPKTKVYQKIVRSYSMHGQGCYMYYRALKHNVENQIYRRLRIPIRTHPYDDFQFVHMDDQLTILVTEFKFLIINSTCGLVEKTFEFQNYCRAIRYANYLIAITSDSNVKIWNIKDGTVVINKQLEIYHYARVIEACKHLIIFINKMVYSVYMLDLRTKECRHISEAKYACCSKDLVAFLLNNGNIIIRDTDYRCVTSFNCSDLSREYKMVDVMKMNEDFLVIEYFELNNTRLLSIFNIKTKANFNIPILSRGPSYCKISKNRLVFGTGNTCMEIWDMCTQNRLFKIDNIDYDHPHSPKLCDSYIYVCPKSDAVKWQIWCLQTGKLIRKLRFYRDQEVIAISNSKLLCKWTYNKDHWQIRDFEASMYPNKPKNKIIFDKKRSGHLKRCL